MSECSNCVLVLGVCEKLLCVDSCNVMSISAVCMRLHCRYMRRRRKRKKQWSRKRRKRDQEQAKHLLQPREGGSIESSVSAKTLAHVM